MSEPPEDNKFLAELTYAVAKGLTQSIKNKIKEIWLKQEYGVTISVEESESLKKISENDFYLLFKKYLGMHWSLNLIKVGIYISELNEEGKRERAKQVYDESFKKYGRKGQRIIQLASTGILVPVMKYIVDLKLDRGANPIVLNREFDKILDEWEQIATPVHRESSEEEINDIIQKKIGVGYPIFFVYASGSASKIAQLTLANMRNKNIFDDKYLMFLKNKVVNNTEYCLWIFEKIEDFQETPLSKQIKE